MKTTLRLPLGQFEFIEVSYDTEMSPEAAVEAFKALKRASSDTPTGLTDKEMGLIIEKMCLGVTVEQGTDLWSKATDTQKLEINRLKRALSRIKAKANKEAEID